MVGELHRRASEHPREGRVSPSDGPIPWPSIHHPAALLFATSSAVDAAARPLDAIAASRRGFLEELVANELECCPAVLHKDRERLGRFWSCASDTRWVGDSEAFVHAASDLQLDRPGVVEHFIETVRRPDMFGPRFNAMVALGKIGATAGDDAASVIEEYIYESSPWVAAVRRLCIQRIRTSASDWVTCADCVRGLVPDSSDAIGYYKGCPTCHGLSWVKSPAR